jgi:cold shock CspA family protein
MTGVVTAIIRGKGYGFIRDSENQERFFHANNLRGGLIWPADANGVPNDETEDRHPIEEGMHVTFTPINIGGHGNGLRAESIYKAA